MNTGPLRNPTSTLLVMALCLTPGMAHSATQDDLAEGVIERISTADMTPDGCYIESPSTLLANDPPPIGNDIFVRDRDTDGNGVCDERGGIRTTRISLGASGTEPNDLILTPAPPADADAASRGGAWPHSGLVAPVLRSPNWVVLYAAPTAQGSGDCSSWANACTLQTALGNAASDDEIWVQAGVHKPTVTTDRTISFTLDSGAYIFGGFDGTETSLDQRDWQANVTILSGDIDNNDVNTDGNFIAETPADIQGNNSYHVLFTDTAAGGTVLDGFVITAGQANGAANTDETRGGGMYNHDNNLWLENLIFSGNTATQYGGGMYNASTDYLWLMNITFSGNTVTGSGGGGGMHNRYSSPVLAGVTFSNSSASQSSMGGGLDNQFSSSPTLTDVTFVNNSAGWGGGMSNYSNCHPELTNATFSGNSATGSSGGTGGGMNNANSSNPTLTNVVFSGNSATNTGGGMSNSVSSSPELTNVVFSGNTVTNWHGGGMANSSGDPVLTNVLFLGNTTRAGGGGMYSQGDCVPDLMNVTFYGNRVTLASGQGGGLYSDYDSYTLLTNVIMWGDIAPASPEIYNANGGTADIAYSDIQGCGGSGSGWVSTCGIDYDGNIDADPRFLDAAGGNLRLQWNSPAIDAGSNEWMPAGLLTDLDDNLRFVDVPTAPDTGSGTPPIVDMGAYEAQVNVAIAKAVSPPAIALGETITFTLMISNSGSITATNVVVTDTLPAFLAGTAFSSSVAITNTGYLTPYVWAVQDLAPRQGGIITVSGVLTALSAGGIYTNTATIADDNDSWAGDNTASVTYTVVVPNVAPTFTSTPVTTATEDTLYTYAVATQDANGDPPAITAPTRPGWLALADHGDGTATLSGAPANADVGDHAVVLRVTDSGGLTDTQSFTVTVANVNDAPFFTSAPVTAAAQGEPYTTTLTASDADLVHGDALTLTAPTLPHWLTITDHGDGTAMLSGTPAKADMGDHDVILRVTDSGGLFAEQVFVITVSSDSYIYLPLVMRENTAAQRPSARPAAVWPWKNVTALTAVTEGSASPLAGVEGQQ
ncbi:MAG: DUF11 domain-containing protein [Anaerolineae bacterium]|nr:DUF11 domain-containing protein [Anaerolineae bacterium]